MSVRLCLPCLKCNPHRSDREPLPITLCDVLMYRDISRALASLKSKKASHAALTRRLRSCLYRSCAGPWSEKSTAKNMNGTIQKTKPRIERNRVLVTGGAGFVGSHLCTYLVERGDHVSPVILA